MPTRDRPTRRIGNSMISPKARNIVVTKSKYGPAAMLLDDRVVGEAEQERRPRTAARCRRSSTPRAKKNSASGIHGRMAPRSVGVRPGRDECPDLVEQDRHREDDPDDDRDLELDDERVARARGTGAGRRAGSGPPGIAMIGREVEPDRRRDRDGEDRAEQPRPKLAEVIDERHDRPIVGRAAGGSAGCGVTGTPPAAGSRRASASVIDDRGAAT